MVGNLARSLRTDNNKGMEQTNPRLRCASVRLAFADHMDRKGQANWGAACAKPGLLHHFILDLFVATN